MSFRCVGKQVLLSYHQFSCVQSLCQMHHANSSATQICIYLDYSISVVTHHLSLVSSKSYRLKPAHNSSYARTQQAYVYQCWSS